MAAYEILQWDSEFFGFAVARIDPGIATPEELKRAAAELRARSVRLAYWLPQQNDRNTLLARQCGGTLIGGHARYESEISPPQAGAARALPVEPLPRGEVTPDLHALALGAGHTFIVFLGEGFFPVNVLNALKMVPEVCRIFCATANRTEVVIAQTDQGRGILGVVDGASPKGVEAEADVTWRKNLLRQIGYKL